jgi:DNA-binding NtrC family response regulator
VYWKRGRLDRSAEMATRCIQEAAAVGAGPAEWYASLLMGMILLHRGEFTKASALFTRKHDWEVPRSDSRPSLLTTEFLGDVHLDQGQAEQALSYYERVWHEALALLPKGDIVAELRRRRAECYYLLGREPEALDEAEIGLAHCREIGDRYEEAATYRMLALASAALGKPAEAKRWFDKGFAYYDDIETPYEWGKLWMAYGDWQRGPHAGEYADLRGALEAYHAARDQFERMGAEAKLAEANARIASMASGRSSDAVQGTPAPVADVDLTRPRRRPRASAETDRRSAWALETFGFLTRNRMVLDLLSDVGKLAAADAPMLILGESGTGKELVANGVHRLSGRKGQFVPINCANLPREVIESELFGHVAGSFTGATRDKPGLFEVCDGGTAFLDEIAEMPLELQARLLRFLETGEVRRVGSNRNLAIDSLVVAATNRDRAGLEKGEGFRLDLYYRLAQAVVVIPPLRKRGEDVELLVGHFFDEACRVQGKQLRLADGARRRLVAHAWPGNVRQLRGVLQRLVILGTSDHEIPAEAVQLDDAEVASTLSEELLQAERRRMIEALAQARGSRSDAARALGMARTTLVTKMKRYGIR